MDDASHVEGDGHTSDPIHFLECAACRAIDAADGSIDGRVFDLSHWNVLSERQHFRWLMTQQDLAADKVTAFAGSLKFVYIHAIWFGLWITINVGLMGVGLEFDKYPFGLLTMVVSLEAIFLATFVMVSQNSQAKRSDFRAQIDFESNLRSLIWTTHVASQLGVDIKHVDEIVALAIEQARKTIGDERAKSKRKPADVGVEN